MANEKQEIIEEENVFFVESIFGHVTKRGLVRLSYGMMFDITVSPSEARMMAMSMLEAAEAAEVDEMLMGFLKDRVGVEDEMLQALVLVDFRTTRAEFRKREQADIEAEQKRRVERGDG